MRWAERLNYGQRLVGTAAGFLTFGAGGLVFAALIVPWVWASQRKGAARERALRRWISRAFRTHVNMLRAFGVLEYRLTGADALRQGRIVIANHPTLLDVVFLVGFIENATCVVKAGLFENFFIGRVIRIAGYVSNDDPERMIRACAQSLDNGATVVIFPEGTRSEPGREPHLQRGAAYIALESGVPLTPVRIRCVPSSLTKAERWFEIPARKMQFDFDVLEPLCVTAHSNKPRALAGRSVNDEIRRVLFEAPEMESMHVSDVSA